MAADADAVTAAGRAVVDSGKAAAAGDAPSPAASRSVADRGRGRRAMTGGSVGTTVWAILRVGRGRAARRICGLFACSAGPDRADSGAVLILFQTPIQLCA